MSMLRMGKRESLYIPPLVRQPTLVQRAIDLPPLVAPRSISQSAINDERTERQIFSPRMGKDIDSQRVLNRYARLPPLPKLDKAFDQYLSQYRRQINDDLFESNEADVNNAARELLAAKLREQVEWPSYNKRFWLGRFPYFDKHGDLLPGEEESFNDFPIDEKRTLKSANYEDEPFMENKRSMSMLRMGRSTDSRKHLK